MRKITDSLKCISKHVLHVCVASIGALFGVIHLLRKGKEVLDLFAQGQYVIKEDSPFYRMSQFKRPNPEAQELPRKAARMLEATRYLKAQ